MRCLIDANIILDVLLDREPFIQDADKIWILCETERIEGHVTSLAFTNIVYVLRQKLDAEMIQKVLSYLRLIFCFDELKPDDLVKAAALRWDDYEDAVQYVIASRIKADHIVTRNKKDFTQNKISVLNPEELLEAINDPAR